MRNPRLAITDDVLSVEALASSLEAEVRHQGEGCGAVCSFVGIVRATHQGRKVRHLEYEAYEPLARRALHLIASEVSLEWPAGLVAIHHRTGRLEVGEASVIIAAAAAHRGEAFQICRYAIERVKQIVPIWKHEFFEDGEAWVEGALADPDDARAATGAGRGMRVTVQLFARLKDLANEQAFVCDIPAGASAADVWKAVVTRHPALEPFGRSISCAVNEDFARMTTRVNDGDEVAFLPPVSGGSGSC